jgi:predicted dehydrogenase
MKTPPLQIGIIGFDTSHVPAFTQLLNDESDANHIPGAKVVAGFPSFSADLASSAGRVEGYTADMKEKYQVDIVDSIEALVERCDAILLESVDGRRHLEEATPVIKAGKPLFIDKPMADNFANASAIAQLARKYSSPVFSSSSLRYDVNIQTIKADPALGEVIGCDAFSPAALDPSNPGLFWYGIHGVEMLYTFMGAGCRSVRCTHNSDAEVVVATWSDGRVGTMRGTRQGAHDYGVTVFGSEKVEQARYSRTVPMYGQLLQQILPFFQGGPAPVTFEETLEIMAFMQAALISSQENREVQIAELIN